jgi:hypothetical protein
MKEILLNRKNSSNNNKQVEEYLIKNISKSPFRGQGHEKSNRWFK